MQASSGYSPFYLDCGQHPITPGSLLNPIGKTSNVEATDDFIQHLQATISMAKDALIAAQDRQAKYANQHRQDDKFNVGEKVMLSTAHLTSQADSRRPLRKLQPKFIGPFRIATVISATVY